MKKSLVIAIASCLITTVLQAQFQKIQRTDRPVQVTKTAPFVNDGTILKNTNPPPPPTPPAPNNTRAVKVINIGGGNNITVTLKRNANTGGDPAFTKVGKSNPVVEKSPAMECVSKKVVFTAESTTFMNGNNSNQIKLYPGAIYSFDDFYGGGYNDIITGRNPIRIYTDQPVNVGATSGIVISNPSGYDINNGSTGIGVIRNSIIQGNSGLGLQYRSYAASSESELALKVTAGGSYGGFSASASYGLNMVNDRYFLTIDAIKSMYTLRAEKPASGFFNDPALAATPNLLYVKDVTYGTRILANIELKFDQRTDAANFAAAYGQQGGVNFNLGGNFINKSTTQSRTANTYIIGGPTTTTSFNIDRLEADIQAFLATCTFQHARPIAYTLGDMTGANCATASATDEYIDRICTPNDIVYKLTGAVLNITTGADNKEFPSQVALEIYNRQTSGILFHQPFEANKGEFKINQDITIGLDKHPVANETDLTLASIRQGGLALRIYYKPNWATDAWKIEGATVTLIFRDQNGNEPPTNLIPKNVTFNNATGFLNNWDHVLTCQTNGDLRPTTSSISQQ